MGTKQYRLDGQTYECPDADYGHVMLQRAKLYWSANIGLQYQTLDWSQYPHPEITDEIESYIKQFPYMRAQGIGATFSSVDLGVGKTWGATHLLKELVKQGVDGWFVPFWELLEYKNWPEEEDKRFRVNRVKTSELLVIDDIKEPYTVRMGEYSGDKLEEFLRPRSDKNLPTIVTTNMTPREFESHFPRVHSLLMAKNIQFELRGDDARMDGTVWEINQRLALAGESRPIS